MFRKFIFVAVLLLATISVVVADDKPKANFIEDTIRKIKELFSGAPKPVAEKAAPAVEKKTEPVQEVKTDHWRHTPYGNIETRTMIFQFVRTRACTVDKYPSTTYSLQLATPFTAHTQK